MGEISKLLNKYFSKDAIRMFSIEGRADDIKYQLSHGFKREKWMKMAGRVQLVGYELTEKGKKQIEKDNIEYLKIVETVTDDEFTTGISAYWKEVRRYRWAHPNYDIKKEFKSMSEDERYAYQHLERVAADSLWGLAVEENEQNYKETACKRPHKR